MQNRRARAARRFCILILKELTKPITPCGDALSLEVENHIITPTMNKLLSLILVLMASTAMAQITEPADTP